MVFCEVPSQSRIFLFVMFLLFFLKICDVFCDSSLEHLPHLCCSYAGMRETELEVSMV